MLSKTIYIWLIYIVTSVTVSKKALKETHQASIDRSVMEKRIKPNFSSMEHRHVFISYLYN